MNAPPLKPIEAERALLRGILLKPENLLSIRDLLPSDFADRQHRTIYQAIMALHEAGKTVDFVSVGDHLGARHPGINWFSEVAEALREHHGAPDNAPAYAAIVIAASKRRALARVGQQLQEEAAKGEEDAGPRAVRSLLDILGQQSQNHEHPMSDAVSAALDGLQDAIDRKGIPGIPSGLKTLDEALGGFHAGDLVVIAGRPAMGKTALGLTLALGAAHSGVPVGFMSSEQPRDQIALRLLSMTARVNLHSLRIGDINPTQIDHLMIAGTRVSNLPISINDKPAPTVDDVIRQAHAWRYRQGIELLVVDYLQRLTITKDRPRHEGIGEAAQRLKELARSLGIPVIALAQLNRASESRADGRPRLSDLRDSGQIEQEADAVLLLHRPEVYQPNNAALRGVSEVDIAKNRHGPDGVIKLQFLHQFTRFTDPTNGGTTS